MSAVWLGLITSLITGTSAVLAVIATQSATTRRETAARERERQDAADRERRESHKRLIEAAMELRTHLEFVGKSRWSDMDERLARLEELATQVSVASGILARFEDLDTIRAARALSKAAVELAAAVAAQVGPEREFRSRIAFEPFDALLNDFLTLGGRDSAVVPAVEKAPRRLFLLRR
ncbi:hypothetical protein AB0C14_25700 [Microbispora hainanensis]|uniref:hypothetical protein n=1 Tax=Microbispora hainanensis TaxID=568844 RepID=UPI003407480E